MSDSHCVRCGATLKVGMLKSNSKLNKIELEIINLWAVEALEGACNQCGDETYRQACAELRVELEQVRSELRENLVKVPILSLQRPQDWQFQPLTLVTAQSVTGTGIFSDVASTFTDIFGTQSETYNAKLREGENRCKASLRAQAIERGGNAVLGVDVDYAEVGGGKAMLMVCMTGTVVKVTNGDGDLLSRLAPLDEAYRKSLRARKVQAAFAKLGHI